MLPIYGLYFYVLSSMFQVVTCVNVSALKYRFQTVMDNASNQIISILFSRVSDFDFSTELPRSVSVSE